MKKRVVEKTKRIFTVFLSVLFLTASILPIYAEAVTTSTAKDDGTFTNPVIYSDVPDVDVIRVGDAYYMSSTTMHLSPGCPIMRSYDLVNWEIINYVYDVIDNSDALTLRNGQSAYGKGSWASSLRYYNGTFYVVYATYTTGKTYVYQTEDIENGPWRKSVLDGVYHDMSLLFDDDGSVYMVYGGGDIRIIELTSDATAIKQGGLDKIIIPNSASIAGGNSDTLSEGSHIYKYNGYYYIFLITWPPGKVRTELCYRSGSIDGTYEGKVVLQDDSGLSGAGIAQGGIVDTVDGNWYAMLFQDHGSVGRIPVLVPVTWGSDHWPVFGVDGKAPIEMQIPVQGQDSKSIVKSDEFYNDAEYKDFSSTTTASTTGYSARSVEPDSGNINLLSDESSEGAELIENGGFEDGLTPWTGNDTAQVSISNTQSCSGDYSILATGRTTTGSGPMQYITGKVTPGGVYKVSARIFYTEGPAEKRFQLCFRNGSDWTGIEIACGGTVKKGEWGTIEGTYTVPLGADISETSIFLETPWTGTPDATNDLMDFYVDDVSIIEESIPEPVVTELIENGGFEDGIQPWTGNDTAQVSISDEESYSGDYSILATGRTTTGSGPMQYITGKVTPGGVYKVSARILYTEGPDEKRFQLCFRNGSNIQIACGGTVNKGEWGTIEGTYTVPSDADITETSIFLETPWTGTPDQTNDLMDFYVDDVSIIEESVPNKNDVINDGENDYNGSNLDLVWQWNHNPDNNNWSLTKRSGYLRLTTGKVSSGLMDARNTLTQRTYGPECSGKTAIDVSNMKDGDVAGLAAFQQYYGYVGVEMKNNQKSIMMVNARNGIEAVESIPLNQDRVYLKIDFDFKNVTDKAYFYYSLDGINWTKIGNTLQMSYELSHFMGYRFALFNYAAKTAGGYVDFDYFRVDDKMTGEGTADTLQAGLGSVDDIYGVQNMELEVPVTMASLPAGTYKGITASLNIPENLNVADVEFNTANISGNCTYKYANNQLQLKVSGDSVNFTNKTSDLFATIKLKVDGFVAKDTTVSLSLDYIDVKGDNAVYDVNNASTNIKLKYLDTGALAKLPGYSNPLITHKYGADPYALAYDGRVYIYMTNDDQGSSYENGNLKYNDYGLIKSINIISSADMVNWTDHGSVPVAGTDGIAKWAGNSWAPAAAHKVIDGKDKFFLYFCNGAGGVGVLEADSPVGPWTDPRGKALVDRNTIGVGYTQNDPNAANPTVWIFDPAVLADDDGNGYLYFGGGVPNDGATAADANNPKTARVIKLGDDMVSLAYETDSQDPGAIVIDAPCMFENSGIHKYNGKYYYSYCTNFAGQRYEGYPGDGQLCYMVSDSPTGPFEYVGLLMDNPYSFFGVGGNNHHAVFEFDNKWYITYHAQTLNKAIVGNGETKGYRSTHINEIGFYSNGKVKKIIGDYEGVSQLTELNPYIQNEAETIGWQSGINTSVLEETNSTPTQTVNMQLTDIHDGDWLAISGADFGENGASAFEANIASAVGGKIEIRIDSTIGDVIGTLEVASTGGENVWKKFSCDVKNITGVHNIFLMFEGSGTENLLNMDNWKFTEKEVKPEDPDKSELTKMLNEYAKLKSSDYTEESWNAFNKAYLKAQDVLNNINATQDEINTALTELEAAKKSLKEKTAPEPEPTLSKPSISKVTSKGYKSLKITWKKVSGAAGYEVYRAASQKGTYKLVSTRNGGNNVSYTNGKLKTGKKYFYKVRAFGTVNGKKLYSPYSAVKSGKPVPATVKVTAVKNLSGNRIQLKWKKVKGANGYQIYRATKKNGKYKNIKTIKKGSTLKFVDSGLTKNKTYYYKIRAYRTVNKTKVLGTFSNRKYKKVMK